MFKRAFLSIGIVALLVTGIGSAGDACTFDATGDHACCAPPEVNTTSSCCSSADTTTPNSEDALACTCVHPPNTPATVVAANGASDPEDDGQAVRSPVVSVTDAPTPSGVRAIEHRVRSHPPPPAYLLNCTNLN